MTVPFVDLRAQNNSIMGAIEPAITRVISRSNFIQGEEVGLFEREFADYCGVREAVGVASGTEALRLSLLACRVGPGDEVITTPFTFIATAEAISQVGATPVFVDVDPESCNVDTQGIEAAITSRTKAILPVHLYGRPANMDRIGAIAKAYELMVIEDACQAHGARYAGVRVGGMGDVGCFSFYPSMNLGAFGDAGMMVTNDSGIAEEVRLLRDHGRKEKYEHLRVGFNGRMDTLQAAVLRVKLTRLDRWTARRQAIAATYRRLLQNEDIRLFDDDNGAESVQHLFVIRTGQRGHLRRALTAAGIETAVHYPIALHLQPAYRHLGYQMGDFPESEHAAREVLSLPMFPELTDGQVHQVAEAVIEALSPVRVRIGAV